MEMVNAASKYQISRETPSSLFFGLRQPLMSPPTFGIEQNSHAVLTVLMAHSKNGIQRARTRCMYVS